MSSEFRRIERLPPYVFNEVNELKAKARARGEGILSIWGWETLSMANSSHAANKFRGSSRIYLFRSELWLSTWPGTVSLLFFEDLISPRGPVMGKGL